MAYQHLVADERLAKSASEGCVVEQRIVSESARAAWRIQNVALYLSAKKVDQLAILDERDNTDKPRCPIGVPCHSLQQERIVVGVGGFRTGVARRIHSGRALERIDF